MGATFQATAVLEDSDTFQKAAKMVLRFILSVISLILQDSSFNLVPPMLTHCSQTIAVKVTGDSLLQLLSLATVNL